MITYVPQSLKDKAMSRSDWPEFESMMKNAYGSDWRLVSYEEMATRPPEGEDNHEE